VDEAGDVARSHAARDEVLLARVAGQRSGGQGGPGPDGVACAAEASAHGGVDEEARAGPGRPDEAVRVGDAAYPQRPVPGKVETGAGRGRLVAVHLRGVEAREGHDVAHRAGSLVHEDARRAEWTDAAFALQGIEDRLDRLG